MFCYILIYYIYTQAKKQIYEESSSQIKSLYIHFCVNEGFVLYQKYSRRTVVMNFNNGYEIRMITKDYYVLCFICQKLWLLTSKQGFAVSKYTK